MKCEFCEKEILCSFEDVYHDLYEDKHYHIKCISIINALKDKVIRKKVKEIVR